MPHSSPKRPISASEELDATLRHELSDLQRQGLRRRLRNMAGCHTARVEVDGQPVLMLAGANYLGLASDPRVIEAGSEAARQFGTAAGGARLISGNLSIHDRLEAELAGFTGAESTLLFSTGYMANLGVLTALAGPEDAIVSDALNHASIIDGCRLSQAEVRVFRHNDVEDFTRVCAGLSGYRRRILIVDGLFSMDGDVAPLAEIVPVARRHDMIVVVDDAHGLGVLGEQGRGVVEHENVTADVVIGNLGKALGSFGAYVCCSATVREYLINRCRPFIFTCALPPAAVGAAQAALQILRSEPERRRQLMQRAAQLRAGLQAAGYDTLHSHTHIIPAIAGSNERAVELSEAAWQRGVYVQAIRYPSVPRGTARLRFTPTCLHSAEDIAEVINIMAELAQSSSER